MVLVKLGGEAEVGCEVAKAMAEDFLSLGDGFPDEEEDVGGVLAPGGKGGVAIDDEVLEGVEAPPVPFLGPEGEFVEDVVRELVILPDGLGNLLSEVDGLLEEGPDLPVEVRKTSLSLLVLLLAVHE